MTKTLLSLLVAAAVAPVAQAASFTAGDIAIYRVGNGTAALGSTATAVFIDEYTAAGAFVQSIAMPTLSAAGSFALTASGSATSEGLLTRSTDGSSLVLTGYNAVVGTTGVAATTAANVARVVGVVDADGNVNTSTSLGANFSGNNIRSVASTDGKALWVAGATSGVVYTTTGSTGGTVVSNTVANNRQLEIFNGQLYSDTSSGTAVRLGTVGTGTPSAAGNVITSLPGLSATTGSPYAFFMADLNANVSGLDTLYISDDAAGLQKFSFNGTAWSASGTIAVAGNGLRGLTGSVDGSGKVTLFGTTASTLYSFVDATGSTGTLSGSLTTLASAATNTAFRGVALAPTITAAVPEPQTYALMLSGLLAVGFIARRRRG